MQYDLKSESFLSNQINKNNHGIKSIAMQTSIKKACEIANTRCIENLLNCFYRETLESGKYVDVLSRMEVKEHYFNLPKAIKNHSNSFMRLKLVTVDSEILIAIKHDSKIGFCHYQSMPYLKINVSEWKMLTWHDLATLLLTELANYHQQPFNTELLEQIKNSVQVMATIVNFRMHLDKDEIQDLSFINSEQSLHFGHTFHPTPKSREDLSLEDVYQFSPEFKTTFPLYYFSVRKDLLIQKSLLNKSAIDLVGEHAPAHLQQVDNYHVICTHPWQARYLKELPLVKNAIMNGDIIDLGQDGESYYPTSSVRTVYHPNNDFFYKLSLNVRLTNCVRKNAIYELESAVCLSKMILTKLDAIKQKFANFHIMLEPGFLSVNLPGGTEDERKKVTEGFGMILRQNFSDEQLKDATPILAGALFGKSLSENSPISQNIENLANQLQTNYETAAIKWFQKYVEITLQPLLDCHFNFGITFEPHLQNVLIGMQDYMPTSIFIRDLEGTKLSAEYWPIELLADLDEKTKQSIYYSEELGWNRIAYCLLVNNIGEAIFHIANGCANLESILWGIVRQQLTTFQEKYGNVHAKKRISGLLSTDALPIKGNFMTRLLKKADKQSAYYYLADHPLLDNAVC